MALSALLRWPAFAGGFALFITSSACELLAGITLKEAPEASDASVDADATMGVDADAGTATDAFPDAPNDGDGDARTLNPLLGCLDGPIYKSCDGAVDGGAINVCSDPKNCGECGQVCDTENAYGCGLGACIDYQTAGWPIGNPDYEIQVGDASAFDRQTGLLWERSFWGQGSVLIGEAVNHCANDLPREEGALDWHVPTRAEAMTLFDETRDTPATNGNVFPTPGGDSDFSWMWTHANDDKLYQQIHYRLGLTFVDGGPAAYLRCVARKLPTSAKVKTWIGRELERHGAEVHDLVNNLVWQAEVSKDGTAPVTRTQSAAQTHCANLPTTAGGKTWRLPTLRELESIMNPRKKTNVFVDPDLFPDTPAGPFWSSTAYHPEPNKHWTLDMNIPKTNGALDSAGNYVRCVAPTP